MSRFRYVVPFRIERACREAGIAVQPLEWTEVASDVYEMRAYGFHFVVRKETDDGRLREDHKERGIVWRWDEMTPDRKWRAGTGLHHHCSDAEGSQRGAVNHLEHQLNWYIKMRRQIQSNLDAASA